MLMTNIKQTASDENTPFEESHFETSDFESNNRYMKLLAKLGHSLEDLFHHFVSICGAVSKQSLLQIHLPNSLWKTFLLEVNVSTSILQLFALSLATYFLGF
jgi:hypothetical protein